MIIRKAWNCMINKTLVNSFGGSTATVEYMVISSVKLIMAFSWLFMAFHHFWMEYKVLFSSSDRFHYLSFKQVQGTLSGKYCVRARSSYISHELREYFTLVAVVDFQSVSENQEKNSRLKIM